MLSRNFRLQKVGDLQWLKKNYNFSDVAFHIDELLVLDVSRHNRDSREFSAVLKKISRGCFAPIAAGGGVNNLDSARTLLRSGADKVVLNSALTRNLSLVESIAREFGQQCVVASLDLKRDPMGKYHAYSDNGSEKIEKHVPRLVDSFENTVGEIYLNSIDRDGTGQGFDFDTLRELPDQFSSPVILAGGAGNASHLAEGLLDSRVDAVATAHLFNFIGDGLKKARANLIERSDCLAVWPELDAVGLPRSHC